MSLNATPFISWVYQSDADALGDSMRTSSEIHVQHALTLIEEVIGPSEIEGIVFSDNLTVARDFLELHARGGIKLGVPGQNIHLGSETRWRPEDIDGPLVPASNVAMLYRPRADRSRRFVTAQDAMACWLTPMGLSRSPQRHRESFGILAHELGHAKDFALGRAGMPTWEETRREFPSSEAYVPFLVAQEARAEYIAIRAECAAQFCIFGGVSTDGGVEHQVEVLRLSLARLAALKAHPPQDEETWYDPLQDLGYSTGQLAAYADAAAPILTQSGGVTKITTLDLVMQALPSSSGLRSFCLSMAEHLRPLHGLDERAPKSFGMALISATGDLVQSAVAGGDPNRFDRIKKKIAR